MTRKLHKGRPKNIAAYGFSFDSALEVQVFEILRDCVIDGIITNLKYHPESIRIVPKSKYSNERVYTTDFSFEKHGLIYLLEAKAFLTDEDYLKFQVISGFLPSVASRLHFVFAEIELNPQGKELKPLGTLRYPYCYLNSLRGYVTGL